MIRLSPAVKIYVTGSHDQCVAAATKVSELLGLEIGPPRLVSRRNTDTYRVDLWVSNAQLSLARLLSRVTPGYDGCWIYTGTIDRFGYGSFDFDGSKGAHRSAYKLLVGPILDGHDLDHLCHSRDLTCSGGISCIHRRCVNPSHLEPVAHSEHGAKRIPRRKSHCPSGHPYAGENLIVRPPSKHGRSPIRVCRTCANAATARYRRKQQP